MGRSPRYCSKDGLIKGAWTAVEDETLVEFVKKHGERKWSCLAKNAGLKRCGKSCRLRWMNYLRPDIKRGNISEDEEDLIIRMHKLLGNRWSLIAGRLPGRTDNEIKNHWHSYLSKKANDHEQFPIPASSSHKKLPDTIHNEDNDNAVVLLQCNVAHFTAKKQMEDKKEDNININAIEQSASGDTNGLNKKSNVPFPISQENISSSDHFSNYNLTPEDVGKMSDDRNDCRKLTVDVDANQSMINAIEGDDGTGCGPDLDLLLSEEMEKIRVCSSRTGECGEPNYMISDIQRFLLESNDGWSLGNEMDALFLDD